MHLESKKARFADVARVFRMVRGFSAMLVLSIIIRAIAKITTIMLPVTMALLVEQIWSGQISLFSDYLMAIIVEGVAVVGFSYLDTYVSHDISFRIIKMLREKIYNHMDKIAPGGLNGINTVDTATIVLSDINVFEWFYAHCLVEWMGTFLTLIVCITLLGQVSVPAGVVVVFLLGLMLVVPLFSTSNAQQKGILMKQLFGALNATVADGVLGNKDIVGYKWIAIFWDKLNKASRGYSMAQGKFAGRNEWEKTIEAILAGAAVLIGTLIVYGQSEGEQITNLISVFVLILAAVNCIRESLSEGKNFGFVFGAAARIVKILDIQPPVTDKGKKTVGDLVTSEGYRIAFQDVGFRYPDEKENPVLENVTFEARASETVAIVSASGGGKTTIGKLLQRFWDVEKGAIYINGIDIRDMRLNTLRDIVTVIPQETYLFQGSIWDNMKLVKPDASAQEIESAIKKAQADSFIKKLEQGLDTIIGENGVMLSGGERQRIALAQAFLKQAPILVLDEATSALDTENERKINSIIQNDRLGKVTLVIAHRLSSMQSADYIVFLKDGYVFRIGSYQELIQDCDEFKDLVRGEYLEK